MIRISSGYCDSAGRMRTVRDWFIRKEMRRSSDGPFMVRVSPEEAARRGLRIVFNDRIVKHERTASLRGYLLPCGARTWSLRNTKIPVSENAGAIEMWEIARLHTDPPGRGLVTAIDIQCRLHR